MSIPFGISVAELAAIEVIDNLALFLSTHNIGGFVPNVAIEEIHHDELAITDHPVERNAAISDHAYKQPMEVIIRAGWSNSGITALSSGGPLAVINPSYIQSVYDGLLALQQSCQLLTIITAKRKYSNMLIKRLSTSTTEKTNNALLLTCECRQVILVDTQVEAFPANANQQTPAVTAPIQNQGAVAPVTAPDFNSSAAAFTPPTDAAFKLPVATTTQVDPTGGSVNIGGF